MCADVRRQPWKGRGSSTQRPWAECDTGTPDSLRRRGGRGLLHILGGRVAALCARMCPDAALCCLCAGGWGAARAGAGQARPETGDGKEEGFLAKLKKMFSS